MLKSLTCVLTYPVLPSVALLTSPIKSYFSLKYIKLSARRSWMFDLVWFLYSFWCFLTTCTEAVFSKLMYFLKEAGLFTFCLKLARVWWVTVGEVLYGFASSWFPKEHLARWSSGESLDPSLTAVIMVSSTVVQYTERKASLVSQIVMKSPTWTCPICAVSFTNKRQEWKPLWKVQKSPVVFLSYRGVPWKEYSTASTHLPQPGTLASAKTHQTKLTQSLSQSPQSVDISAELLLVTECFTHIIVFFLKVLCGEH